MLHLSLISNIYSASSASLVLMTATGYDQNSIDNGLTKYITGCTGLTGAIVDITGW